MLVSICPDAHPLTTVMVGLLGPPVPLPPTQPSPVGGVGVIEAWVLCFCGVEMAIEGLRFHANLSNEVSRQERLESLRIVGLGLGKQLVVDEPLDRTALHDDGGGLE